MTVVERAGTSNESGRVPLLVIIASVREARFGPVVGHWFARRAREHNRVAVDTVDLAATPIPASLARDATVDAFAARVGAAEAVVVVTPEYNHGYPGALKNALDAVREEWAAKPVAALAPDGVDAALDLVGGESVPASLALGIASTRIGTTVDTDAVRIHGIQRVGGRSLDALREVTELAATGTLRVPVEASLALGEAAEAHRRIERGHTRGKLALHVS